MSFRILKLGHWKQFREVNLDIHPRVTVITGANGAGKTTIINLFARHFGWGHQEIGTPEKDKSTGLFGYFFRLKWLGLGEEQDRIRIGEIGYGSGKACKVTIPKEGATTYQPEIHQQQPVQGLAIPSHRSIYRYEAVQNISTSKRSKEHAFNLARDLQINRYFGHTSQAGNYNIKETLISWAIFGGGNKHIDPDPQQSGWYTGFEDVLRKVLPAHIGFKNIVIRGQNDVVLAATPNDFVIDAVSGGLSAIIDLAWQIYLSAKDKEPITVVIDEVENHLHAEMQRRLMPSFIDAFPNVQFIVTTHSPLIVGSVRDSSVYALRYDKEMKVYSEKLDLTEKGKAANDILREVLGVPFTMPIWVEEKLDAIVKRYRGRDFSKSTLEELRQEMQQAGMGHLTGEGLLRITEGQQ